MKPRKLDLKTIKKEPSTASKHPHKDKITKVVAAGSKLPEMKFVGNVNEADYLSPSL